MKTRLAAARSACAIWPTSTRSTPSSTASVPTTTLRAGFGQPPVDRAAMLAELREIAPSCCNSPSRCGSA
jgi:hypothetical protein